MAFFASAGIFIFFEVCVDLSAAASLPKLHGMIVLIVTVPRAWFSSPAHSLSLRRPKNVIHCCNSI